MNTKKLSELGIIFISSVMFIYILREFQSFLRPLILALLLSFIFTPLYRYSKEERLKNLIKINLFMAGLFILVIVIGTTLISHLATMSQSVELHITPQFLKEVSFKFADYKYSLSDFISYEDLVLNSFSIMNVILDGITKFIYEFFLIVLFMIFILPSLNIWIRSYSRKLSRSKKTKFIKTLNNMENGIKDYFNTKLLISFLTAFISFVVLFMFGVKYPLVFAILIFALNFIPNIGSIFAVGLTLIAELLFSGFSISLIFMGIILILIQVLFGSILEPKIAGKRLELSPLAVLISLFFWGAIWGIVGMFFSVLLTLGIKNILQHFDSTKEIAKWIM